MSKHKRYTITAALPYTNGSVHIGHLAGVYIPADIYARYMRLKGKDVLFVCGSDEHGVPITIKAKKEGVTPQQVVDKYHNIIKTSFEDFGISFDNYSRTSDEIHHNTASEFFTKLYDNDKFIEQTTDQLYDADAKQFLADRFVVGTCPKCGNDESYGDQCEKCGTSHNATDLINPKSAITGNVPSLKSTKHWFLPLDKYSNFLKEWIVDGHKDDWKTNVYGQVKSWIDDGLKPRAVTRDLDWGIKVPIEGVDSKVLYVWFDAPIGYISATKQWAEQQNKDWEPYWKDEDTKLVHFIGKDNIVFHCIIFPAMLKAEGSYILPENVPANEFLNLEGKKLSTSKNWAVWLDQYLIDFPNKQDVLRYSLTSIAPETKDSDFTWGDFQTKNNSELVAIFGNFINRVTVLTHKYYEGIVPKSGEFTSIDLGTLSKLAELPLEVDLLIEKYKFRDAQTAMMSIARLGNKYLADEEPWKKMKTDPERVKTIMYVALQISTVLAIVSEPFLPFTNQKMSEMLNINNLSWSNLSSDCSKLMHEGHTINKAELLFEKIEDSQVELQTNKLEESKKLNELANEKPEPIKPLIEFDDFSKLDIRIGTILEASKMAKTKKLLILKVDMGMEVRQIVSGIAHCFKPEDIIGQKVCVLVNLETKKIKGVESNGMILMTELSEGNLDFISPSSLSVSNGKTVG
ncbi:MAG: methionine--tRNA ligase [Flavobacteriaceae bacterium]|nr:methionine--tRNA ligase [Flavobacteriaceae bacterium]